MGVRDPHAEVFLPSVELSRYLLPLKSWSMCLTVGIQRSLPHNCSNLCEECMSC